MGADRSQGFATYKPSAHRGLRSSSVAARLHERLSQRCLPVDRRDGAGVALPWTPPSSFKLRKVRTVSGTLDDCGARPILPRCERRNAAKRAAYRVRAEPKSLQLLLVGSGRTLRYAERAIRHSAARLLADAQGAADTAQPLQDLDPHRLSQRQRQIDFGKNTAGYTAYTAKVPKCAPRPDFCNAAVTEDPKPQRHCGRHCSGPVCAGLTASSAR